MELQTVESAIIKVQTSLKAQLADAQKAKTDAHDKIYFLDGGIQALGALWTELNEPVPESPLKKKTVTKKKATTVKRKARSKSAGKS